MADYFTNFSFQVCLPNEAAQTYALKLAADGSRLNQDESAQVELLARRGVWRLSPGRLNQDEPAQVELPDGLQEHAEDWCFEAEACIADNQPGLWLHSSNGGIHAVSAFLQHLLRKFFPSGQVTFEWSHHCSKPRIDAYGGGAAIITAKKIKTMSTCQWIRKHAR